MTSSDTLFATTRLTLGLSRQHAAPLPPSTLPKHSITHPDDDLDRRKRRRDDQSHYTKEGAQQSYTQLGLIVDNILIPLPRPPSTDPPLLAYRYLPISIAGEGAFSRTILAQDVLDPKRPVVAIKAMKPGFEPIGQQEYNLLRRIQNLPMPKRTNLPIVHARASFSASSTYHLVLEALQPSGICLPECPHRPICSTPSSCPIRHDALRKVASQLLLGISILHDQMGYIHADLKPENILRCRDGSATSMKLKLIDLGNAVPIDCTNVYYSDFEVQSVHYRAPEVLLGLPFTPSVDIFSLGLILAELLLAKPDPPASTGRHQQPSFPASAPLSHSPQRFHNLPLLSTYTSNRRSFIEQTIRLFGPLPPSFQAGKFWSDEYSYDTFAQNGTLLFQYLETEGIDPDLIDFIMRMLTVDPEKRISAREALKHEWLVGPLLGYWAALGVEWTPLERRDQCGQRPVQVMRDGPLESQLSTLEHTNVHSEQERKRPPLYDFSTIEDDEDDDEVSLVYAASSPTKPLSFVDHTEISETERDDDDEVLLL